jgi:hypothetical protein
MRLWTLHPEYLDARGLVALWREGLLARAVLRGRTRGYRHHPQLERFRAHPAPVSAINTYLVQIHIEAARRGYAFDRSRVGPARACDPIRATSGQIAHEWGHLMAKLEARDPARFNALRAAPAAPRPHPSFRVVRGGVEGWERV